MMLSICYWQYIELIVYKQMIYKSYARYEEKKKTLNKFWNDFKIMLIAFMNQMKLKIPYSNMFAVHTHFLSC